MSQTSVRADTPSGAAMTPGEPVGRSPIINFARWYQGLNEVLVSVLAIVLALIIGGVVIDVATGQLTMGLTAYDALFTGAFGSWPDITQTLIDATPLVFTALAVAFAFRGGLFNIGAEGQMYVGAIASTAIGVTFDWPGWVLLPVCVIAAAVAGGLFGMIPGVLKAYRGAHEVITTMMLNYIGLYLLEYCVESNSGNGTLGPLQNPALFGEPESKFVNVFFPSITIPFVSGGQINTALLLAIACGGLFSFLLWRTTFGYAVRAVGFNIKAARYAGIKVSRSVVAIMVVSGAFAGLAGVAVIFGNDQYLGDNFDGFTLGFYGIAVALLGRNTAVGAILAAILFGAFVQGGLAMQFANVDVNIIGMIQGLVIFFIGADALVRYVGNRGAMVARLGIGRRESSVPAESAPI